MRRAKIVLGLTSSAIAVAAVALFSGNGFYPSPGAEEPAREESTQSQKSSSIDTPVNEAAAPVAPQKSLRAVHDPTVTESDSDTDFAPSRSYVDEETTRKMVREDATRDVPRLYSLLLGHLDLAPSKEDALISILIEIRIAATHTDYTRGKTIDPQERSDKIADIIGDHQLQRFLALERNLASYAQVQNMESVLQHHGLSVTETQRDRMLEILIDIQDRDLRLPRSDAKKGSIEFLEFRLAQIDERERLVLEQATSVLSAEQVRRLFEHYQRDSYRRADALEVQRKARDGGSDEDLPLWYPARSYPDSPR